MKDRTSRQAKGRKDSAGAGFLRGSQPRTRKSRAKKTDQPKEETATTKNLPEDFADQVLTGTNTGRIETSKSNITEVEKPSTTAEQNPLADVKATEVSSESHAVNPGTEEEKKIMKVTFTKLRTNKAGGTLYRQEGSSASVRFPKSLFAEGQPPPDTITLEAPDGVLAAPGAAKAKVTTEEQAEKIRVNAEKAKARADKAAARAAKAQAKLDALKPAAKTAEAAPATA